MAILVAEFSAVVMNYEVPYWNSLASSIEASASLNQHSRGKGSVAVEGWQQANREKAMRLAAKQGDVAKLRDFS